MRTLGSRAASITLLIGALVSGCGEEASDDGPRSIATVEDPIGDTEWWQSPHAEGPAPTANADISSMTAEYDDRGLRVEVTYAEPLSDDPRPTYMLEVDLEYLSDNAGSEKDISWPWNGFDHAFATNSEGADYGCHPKAEPALTKGRVVISVPKGCFHELPPRIGVSLRSYGAIERDEYIDTMFIDDDDPDQLWLTLA